MGIRPDRAMPLFRVAAEYGSRDFIQVRGQPFKHIRSPINDCLQQRGKHTGAAAQGLIPAIEAVTTLNAVNSANRTVTSTALVTTKPTGEMYASAVSP